MVMRKIFISIMVMGILFMSGSVTTSKTLAPLWSYKIEDITDFAMSRNGEYVIVACEKGPLCDEGQYYVFDQYGNTVDYGCIEGEITAVDIADNGAFFIGTRTGYYFSSSAGRIFEDTNMESTFVSISISENGETVIAGTNKEILIFDNSGIKSRKEINRSVSATAIDTSGDIAVAGTNDTIFSYEKPTDTWGELVTNGTIHDLTISDDGSTIACGMVSRFIWVLDSKLNSKEEFQVSATIVSIALSADGEYVLCGTRQGYIIYFDSSGKEIWEYDVKNRIQKVAISSDGSFMAALCGNIILFNSLGNKLQELKSSETIHDMFLSKFGETLSYKINEELFFLELYQGQGYMIPSRKSIPVDDEFIEVWSYRGDSVNFKIADINGDGQKEIIYNSAEEVTVLDSNGKVMWRKSFTLSFAVNVLDVTGDFIPEIIIQYNGENRMGIQVLDGDGQELAYREFYSRWYSEPPGKDLPISMNTLWSRDIDHDGFMEVVCLLKAGFILEPRGLYAFEYPSFKEEWYYPVAPYLDRTINFIDINGDGQSEIIAGSSAPCNGQYVRDTDDCHAYVYAVTLEGEELWTKQIGTEGYKRVYIAVNDLNSDGTQEIVGGGWSFEDNWGALFVLDSEGNYISGEGNEFDHSVFLLGVADLENNGDSEILIATPSMLILYDHKLREIKRRDVSMPFSEFTYAKINDIDGDGEKEIILTSEDEKLLILNKNLEEEWSKTFPSYYKHLRTRIVNLNKCKNHLFVYADKLYVYTYSHNPDQPCVPWVIAKEEKIREIENSLEETKNSLEQGDVAKATEYVSQAEDAYMSIKNEEGLEEYYEEIEDMKKAMEDSPTKTSESPSETSEPLNLGIIGIIIVVIVSLVTFLEMNYKIIRGFTKRKRITSNLMVLSLEKRSETAYQISLESVNKIIYPVKSFKTIDISPKMRSEIIKRIEYTSEVITTYLDPDRKKPLKTPTEELKKMGTVIYKNFIPREFAHKFVHQYMVLDVEDVQVPWELMYDDGFFALKYALSRRIKSEKVSEIYKSKKRERKALIIADPTGTTPEAVTECEYLKKTLQDYLAVTYLKPEKAKKVDVMYHLSQNYDIIHYAGELKREPCLPVYKDVLTCAEIERTLEGSPVVFLNGCCSAKTFSYSIEGLAEVFLNRGALSYIGSLWSIHDRKAAEIAADFYRNCLSFPVGEALRLSRKNHYSPEDITWAAFVMYGDPTLNLFI